MSINIQNSNQLIRRIVETAWPKAALEIRVMPGAGGGGAGKLVGIVNANTLAEMIEQSSAPRESHNATPEQHETATSAEKPNETD
jgi:formiminotetrahydrofolate cyclodeaminase